MPATENDPTQKFLDATQKYQTRLFQLWKVTFKRVASYLKSLVSFIDNVIKAAAQLASTVGKAVVKKVTEAGLYVKNMIKRIPQMLKNAMKLGKRIIALIKKAADPNAIINTLKKLFRKYVMMFREIFGTITEMVKQLDILGTVLAVVNTFKRVLQMMLSWIGEVTRVNDAVVRSKRLLNKVLKEMRKEVKEAEKMRKEVAKLKVAA